MDLEECAKLTEKTNAAQYKTAHDQTIDKIGKGAMDMFAESGIDDIAGIAKAISHINKCDYVCQQKEREALLLNIWRQSEDEETLAYVQSVIAARNYYYGGTGTTHERYNTVFVSPKISSEVGEITNLINMKATDISNVFHIMSNSYETESVALTKINNLLAIKKQEIEKINKEITDYEKYRNVDIRKNFYEYNEQEFYNYIKFYIQIIYFAIIGVYIFFVDDFTTNNRYKDWRFYLVLFIYIGFPFSIKYIIAFFGYIYDSIDEYFGWKDPIYSYDDLVKNERRPN